MSFFITIQGYLYKEIREASQRNKFIFHFVAKYTIGC